MKPVLVYIVSSFIILIRDRKMIRQKGLVATLLEKQLLLKLADDRQIIRRRREDIIRKRKTFFFCRMFSSQEIVNMNLFERNVPLLEAKIFEIEEIVRSIPANACLLKDGIAGDMNELLELFRKFSY